MRFLAVISIKIPSFIIGKKCIVKSMRFYKLYPLPMEESRRRKKKKKKLLNYLVSVKTPAVEIHRAIDAKIPAGKRVNPS
jgi:hypothetical protein